MYTVCCLLIVDVFGIELLEQGWDSDTEHSDEDILTPKHSNDNSHVET